MNNPFKQLGLSRFATKPDILEKSVKLMKEEPQRLKDIAQAQKTLFDSKARSIAEFVCFLDFPPDLKPKE